MAVGDLSQLEAVLEEVRADLAGDGRGAVADYIPELARADPDRLGIAVCDLDGRTAGVGDADVPFTLQSLSKPFLYGMALARFGDAAVHGRVGVEPTGETFDAIVRLDEEHRRPHNAMVNAGAIAISGLFAGAGVERPVEELLVGLGAFVGRERLDADVPVYLSELENGHKNRAIAHLLRFFHVLEEPVEETLELYFHQCAAQVTARELATMAATLAAGGRHPVTGAQVLPPEVTATVLAVLSTCGLYDSSGRFLFDVGLPGKSGVSGGVLAVAPGRFGLAAFSPRLDGDGNSVRGVAAVRELSARLGLHVLEPVVEQAVERARPPLPEAELPGVLARSHAAARAAQGGRVADYAPALARADAEHVALAVCTVGGAEHAAGDAVRAFTLQAAVNPFAYAWVARELGSERVLERCGVEPSGNAFHTIHFDPRTGRPYNPLGNAGAMVVAGLAPGADDAGRLRGLLAFLGELTGDGPPPVDAAMLAAERRAGERNRAIAALLDGAGLVEDRDDALELYLQQCCIGLDAPRLARMGATLANGGVSPVTGREVVPPRVVRETLALMYACGHHDESGRVAVRIGLPAKSGISGAIVAVAPGRMGIAAFSPAVNEQGTSVRGLAALAELSGALRLGVFEPAAPR